MKFVRKTLLLTLIFMAAAPVGAQAGSCSFNTSPSGGLAATSSFFSSVQPNTSAVQSTGSGTGGFSWNLNANACVTLAPQVYVWNSWNKAVDIGINNTMCCAQNPQGLKNM